MGCACSSPKRRSLPSPFFPQNQIMSPELREDIHEGLGVSLVACSLKGWRKTQEDTSAIVINLGGQKDMLGVGVFDGHSGQEASKYVAENLWNQVIATSEWGHGDVDGALRAAFLAVDASMQRDKVSHGTTAVVAVVTPGFIYVANCGDSRAVLCKGGVATAMSTDHKPGVYTEESRVMRCGGQVIPGECGGVSRVTAPGCMVAMATSRSLGDFHFKRNFNSDPSEQVVSPAAEVVCVQRSAQDEFLILGTDGVWDVLSNQEVSDMMRASDRARRPQAPPPPPATLWENSSAKASAAAMAAGKAAGGKVARGNGAGSSSLTERTNGLASATAPASFTTGHAPVTPHHRQQAPRLGVPSEPAASDADVNSYKSSGSSDVGDEAADPSSCVGMDIDGESAAKTVGGGLTPTKRPAFIRLITPTLVRLITPNPPNPATIVNRETTAAPASAPAAVIKEETPEGYGEGIGIAARKSSPAYAVGNDGRITSGGTLDVFAGGAAVGDIAGAAVNGDGENRNGGGCGVVADTESGAYAVAGEPQRTPGIVAGDEAEPGSAASPAAAVSAAVVNSASAAPRVPASEAAATTTESSAGEAGSRASETHPVLLGARVANVGAEIPLGERGSDVPGVSRVPSEVEGVEDGVAITDQGKQCSGPKARMIRDETTGYNRETPRSSSTGNAENDAVGAVLDTDPTGGVASNGPVRTSGGSAGAGALAAAAADVGSARTSPPTKTAIDPSNLTGSGDVDVDVVGVAGEASEGTPAKACPPETGCGGNAAVDSSNSAPLSAASPPGFAPTPPAKPPGGSGSGIDSYAGGVTPSARTPNECGGGSSGSNSAARATPNRLTPAFARTPVEGAVSSGGGTRTSGGVGHTPSRRTSLSRVTTPSRISSYKRSSGSGLNLNLFKSSGSLSVSMSGKGDRSAMGAVQGVLDQALQKGSQDNMTLIAVDLRGFLEASPPESTSAI